MNYHNLQLQHAISEVLVAICIRKVEYRSWLAQKLVNLSESSKTKCSIIKKFQNGKKGPIIPPVLINNKLESEFKIKANCCDSFFASKCTPLVNSSIAPNSLQYVSTARHYSFCFNEGVILKMINALSINKAYAVSFFLSLCLWFSKLHWYWPTVLVHFEISGRDQT